MRLELNQFAGMAPVVDPTALSERLSTFAKNVRFDKGVLAPGALRLMPTADYPDGSMSGRGVRAVSTLLESKTRFAFSDPNAKNLFPSPVAPADTWGRVYGQGQGGPRYLTTDQYSPGGLHINPLSYRLGIPAPTSAAVVDSTSVEQVFEEGAPAADGSVEQILVEPDSVDVAYLYTFVDKYGHESAPSLASGAATVAYDRDFTVAVTVNATPPGEVNFISGVRRIYRATFDGSSQQWQYLTEIPIGNVSFADSLPLGQEGEALISQDWFPPPEGLQQLCLVSSAFAAGFIDHYLCYSESRLPHAWPPAMQYPLKYNPVQLLPMINGLLVCTTGRPYWAEGVDPWSAFPQELPINAPCLAPDSVVDMGGYALYLSDEGIVSVAQGRGELVSGTFIDRAGIAALVDGSSTAFEFDGRYVFSTVDDRWMGFDPENGLVEYAFGFPPSQFNAVMFNVRDNHHYFAFSDGRIRVVDFEGVATDVEWHSKHWRTPPVSFSCVRVEADLYPVVVQVRSRYLAEDWQETPELEVTGPHIQRLPVHVGSLWEVRVKPPSEGHVYRVVLAQSGEEAS